MAEQRYQAVMAVISDGLSVSQAAEKVGLSRHRIKPRARWWFVRHDRAARWTKRRRPGAGSRNGPGKISDGVASSYGLSIRPRQERGTTHDRKFA